MKRIILTLVLAIATVAAASAQNYMVVNSEKVFKSIEAYNNALESIDALAADYQQQVDARFADVEQLYNNYMQVRATLSDAARQEREAAILDAEANATKYQESLFGSNGELMKKRLELIQPIQAQVFAVIEAISQQNGFDLVIDIASNPTVLYYSSKVDYTEKVIEALK
jgi:outer membrane protein